SGTVAPDAGETSGARVESAPSATSEPPAVGAGSTGASSEVSGDASTVAGRPRPPDRQVRAAGASAAAASAGGMASSPAAPADAGRPASSVESPVSLATGLSSALARPRGRFGFGSACFVILLSLYTRAERAGDLPREAPGATNTARLVDRAGGKFSTRSSGAPRPSRAAGLAADRLAQAHPEHVRHLADRHLD